MEKILIETPTSVMLRFELYDSSVTTGAVKSGLTYQSSSLAVSIAVDGGSGATALTLEDITTIGTYQAPTSSTYCRFKEVDSSDMSGLYELHLHNDALASANGFFLKISGATDLKPRFFYCQMAVPAKLDNVAHGGSSTTIEFQTPPLATLADGAHGGANATVELKSVTVTNSDGNAVVISSTGSGGKALSLYGEGNGEGLYIKGGTTGQGVEILGGDTSGEGVRIGSVQGNSDGVYIYGNGTGSGVHVRAGNTGLGLRVRGGTTSGDGFKIETTDGDGLLISAAGAGKVDINADLPVVTLADGAHGGGGATLELATTTLSGLGTSGDLVSYLLRLYDAAQSIFGENHVSVWGLDGTQSDCIECSFTGNMNGNTVQIDVINRENLNNPGYSIGTWTQAGGFVKDAGFTTMANGGTFEIGFEANGANIDGGIFTITVKRSIIGTTPYSFSFKIPNIPDGNDEWWVILKDGTALMSEWGVAAGDIVKVPTVLADGVAHGGAAASLTLGEGVDIDKTTGPAVTIDAAAGDGLQITATGNGVEVTGDNAGMMIIGNGSAGLTIYTNGSNGNGLEFYGNGSGAGIFAQGGNDGPGLKIVGGSTSGEGITITTTDGDGIVIAASGAGKVDINADLPAVTLADGVAHGGAAATFVTAAGYLSQESSPGATEARALQANDKLSEQYVTAEGFDNTTAAFATITFDGTIPSGQKLELFASDRAYNGTPGTYQNNVDLGYFDDALTWHYDAGWTGPIAGDYNLWALANGGDVTAGTLTIILANDTIVADRGTITLSVPALKDGWSILWDKNGRVIVSGAGVLAPNNTTVLANAAHGGSTASLTLNNVDINRTDGGTALSITATNGSGVVIDATSKGMHIEGGTYGVTIEGGNQSAIQVYTNTGNTSALELIGNGTAPAVILTGGDDGPGLQIIGGSTSGDGINITTTEGHGISSTAGGTGKSGIYADGGTNGHGLYAEGSGTGHGIYGISGTGAGAIGIVGWGVAAGIHGSAHATDPTVGTDYAGISAKGEYAGILSVAGGDAAGVKIVGGSTSGDGINITATDGHAIYAVAGGTNSGVHLQGGTQGDGLELYGGSVSGDGLNITATTGHGIVAQGGGGGNGMMVTGFAGGYGLLVSGSDAAGLKIVCGDTANGVEITGGTTSGDGITITATDGHGISVTAGGVNKHGMTLVKGTGSGKDIDADEIDNAKATPWSFQE